MSIATNANELPFDELMQRGDAANARNLADAISYAALAYTRAEPLSVDQGRAARGLAARYERLDNDVHANSLVINSLGYTATGVQGLPRSARGWLSMAKDIHTVAKERNPHDIAATRELSQDHMYLGLFAAKRHIRREIAGGLVPAQQYHDALTDLEISLSLVAEAAEMRKKQGGHPVDQYKINQLARFSIVLGLAGEQLRGRPYAQEARAIAPLAESPALDTSNTSLTPQQRAEAVHRATRRAQAALLINYTPRVIQRPLRRQVILPRALAAL